MLSKDLAAFGVAEKSTIGLRVKVRLALRDRKVSAEPSRDICIWQTPLMCNLS